MGISSTQVRFLQLTDRKHTIGRELCSLADDKVALTRDMNKASREYQEALTAKTLKWSSNSGVTYHDLSYKNLMQPGMMNSNTAYLLTDSSERVVIDYDYKKYAEKISPSGSPGGKWEGNTRAQILSELTGASADSINKVDSSATNVAAKLAELNKVKGKKPAVPMVNGADITDLLKDLGSQTANGSSFSKEKNWVDAYNKSGEIQLDSKDPGKALSNLGENLANALAKYFVTSDTNFDINQSKWINAVSNAVNGVLTNVNNGEEAGFINKDDKGNLHVDVKKFVNQILLELGSSFSPEAGKVNHVDLAALENYKSTYEAWEAELTAAQKEYNDACDSDNMLLTADQERQIEFYDDVFSAIAEKGWTYNGNITDEDYLNQMLQNNLYTITTVDRKKVQSEDFSEDYFWKNTYNTDIATNYTNIFAVNDADARSDAQVEYERKKAVINAKETKVDTRMQNLKTEQDAINTMLQSLQSILDENVENKFNIFG